MINESWQWPIPLAIKPRALVIAYGAHGDMPSESYQLELWCLHLYTYSGEAVINGQTFPISPGCVSIAPPNTELEHRWPGSGCIHISAHWDLASVSGETASIPVMQNLGDSFGSAYRDLEDAMAVLKTNRCKAEVRLWDLLWRLTTVSAELEDTGRSPAVRQVLQRIELGLAEPLDVAALAEEVSLSRGHLTRLFKRELGTTVIGHIQTRRLELAEHLLQYSSLPVKSIAAQVGIPDLQAFNKIIRKATGKSPRKSRRTTYLIQR